LILYHFLSDRGRQGLTPWRSRAIGICGLTPVVRVSRANQVFDTRTLRVKYRSMAHSFVVSDVAFSPAPTKAQEGAEAGANKPHVISCSLDKSLRIQPQDRPQTGVLT
jgi:hypothetical protein